MKSIIVTKIVGKMDFERSWGELDAKGCFQGQSWTGCMRQALIFVGNAAMREGFNFYFSAVFCYFRGGAFGLGAGLGAEL